MSMLIPAKMGMLSWRYRVNLLKEGGGVNTQYDPWDDPERYNRPLEDDDWRWGGEYKRRPFYGQANNQRAIDRGYMEDEDYSE